MESSRDPSAGEITISVNAAPAAIADNVDVARSDPISAMRADTGEKTTMDMDKTIKKFDAMNTARSLRLHDDDGDDANADEEEGDEDGVVELSLFEASIVFSSLSFLW
jgi:hypothetical protein